MTAEEIAAELWAMAQIIPGEGIEDAINRMTTTIQRAFEEREWKLREAATTQPSGDVVEAVALAILNSDRGMRGLDPLESRENVPDSDGYVTNATAAITTYEAVSGVAKMREALREARSGLCAFTGGPDGACSETIARIDAALGEKP